MCISMRCCVYFMPVRCAKCAPRILLKVVSMSVVHPCVCTDATVDRIKPSVGLRKNSQLLFLVVGPRYLDPLATLGSVVGDRRCRNYCYCLGALLSSLSWEDPLLRLSRSLLTAADYVG